MVQRRKDKQNLEWDVDDDGHRAVKRNIRALDGDERTRTMSMGFGGVCLYTPRTAYRQSCHYPCRLQRQAQDLRL